MIFVVKLVLYTFMFLQFSSSRAIDEECPSLADADNLSQTQLLQRLTHVCRYDRLERPLTYTESGERLPVDVYVRAYVYFMQNLEPHDLQFKMHALLQIRFLDPRLTFRKIAPNRMQPILGQKQLRDTLWQPHIFLANERDSSTMGTNEKDVLTSISPDGTVIISSRIKATLYCWMNLQRFPFDEQQCSTVLESWMYNTSELVLKWELKRPIAFDPALHLTEYVQHHAGSNETIINADLNDLRHGAFAGNYSSLSFSVHLTRQVGFYIMDYFLPSMMLVGISWVSFWLQADQAPPRIMLGTSTMLTFITLASAQGKTLPKVSYIKISEVWFLGCTVFIFGSLLEFAFVNTIWRRKHSVDVKKMNSKHILKSTLSPRLLRRHGRSRSMSVTPSSQKNIDIEMPKFNNYLTVHNIPMISTIKEHENADMASLGTNFKKAREIMKQNKNIVNIENGLNETKAKDNEFAIKLNDSNVNSSNDNNIGVGALPGWTTLTPQEISIWIDRKARCAFPVAFFIFNGFFWTVVFYRHLLDLTKL